MKELEATHEIGSVKNRNEILSEMSASGAVPLLPFELHLLKEEFKKLVADQEANGVMLGEAMQDSSETWHDNAAADIINANSIGLSTQAKKLIWRLRQAVVVEYPPADEETITLGSLVELAFGSEAPEPMLVTGTTTSIPSVYGDSLPVGCDAVTIDSPLGAALMGAQAGDEVSYTVGERKMRVSVSRVVQLDEFDDRGDELMTVSA